jgi:N-acetylmuramic acid 6-phosphate (MurNAc-6-P) etherase
VRIVSQQCQLERPAAEALLDAADGRVKLALVMGLRQLTADQARQLLDEHQGQLRPILGDPRN